LRADPELRIDHPGGLERVMELCAFSAFAGLAPAELAVLADLAEERFVPAGHVIQKEGEPVREIHYLIEGQVEIRRRGCPLARIGPRAVVSQLEALARVAHSDEVVAVVDTSMLSFTLEDQIDVFEDHFRILAGVLRGVAAAVLEAHAASGPDGGLEPAPPAPPAPDGPLGLVEKITALRRAPPYDEARLEELAELARESPEVHHRAGERLWSAGDPAGWALVVVAGCVVGRAAGQELRFTAGSSPGALDSMAGRARGFDATAETDVTGLRIDSGTLLDILEDHTDMALDLFHSMARDALALASSGRAARRVPALASFSPER
jgi:CRP-like cAMP-binding protein